MKTLKIGFSIAIFLLVAGWLQAQTTLGPFTFYPTNQGGTIQGQAQINGVPTVAGDIVAAFNPGNMCAGAGNVVIYEGVAYINFVIYGNDEHNSGMTSGQSFTLKLYQASSGNTITYSPALCCWQDNMFAPMPGFNNPSTIYNFISCTLSVTPSNRNVTAPAGSTTFAVTSTCAWTASSNQTWCTISPASGTGNGTITANYTQNTSINPRTANITVTVAGLTPVVVTVTQAGAACSLSVSPSNQNVSAASGTTTFTVTSNSSWTVSESVTWLSVSPTSGTGNGSFTVTYNANTGAQRVGTISVSASGCTTVNVTVTQEAGCTLTVSPSNQNVSAASGTTTFTVTSNSSWTVSESETWLSVSPTSGSGNGNFTVTYNANTGAQRIGNISVSATGCTSVPVTVTQAAPGIQVTLPNMSGLSGNTVEVPITVGDVTGTGIISMQFAFSYNPAVLSPVSPYITTTGTLTGASGWTMMYNINTPGQMVIGGFSQGNALTGSGTLIKVVFNVIGAGGTTSALNFMNFTFNAGNPATNLVNGLFTVPLKVCGDADQNTLVQVYDAALTLQHAIGVITLPTQGALNADVFEDNTVTAYDAALICQYAIGISPLPATTCFFPTKTVAGSVLYDFPFSGRLANIEKYPEYVQADVIFSGIVRPQTVFAISMDLYSPSVNITNLEMINLPAGYIHFINQVSSHVYRIGIINPGGMLSQDLRFRLKMKDYTPESTLSISGILINDRVFPDIVLSGISTAGKALPAQALSVYPNPFTHSATIVYEVVNDSRVELQIIDLFGREVKTIANAMQEQGFYQAEWNGENNQGSRMPQGWYLIRLKTSNGLQQTKISLIH